VDGSEGVSVIVDALDDIGVAGATAQAADASILETGSNADTFADARNDGRHDTAALFASDGGNAAPVRDANTADVGRDAREVDATSNGDATIDYGASASCARMARAKCGRFAECSPNLFDQRFPTYSFCEAAVEWECQRNLEPPGMAWSVLRAATCAAKTEALSCESWFAVGLDATCEPGPGFLPDGAACSVRAQCGAKSYCTGVATSTCGQCAPVLDIGVDCSAQLLGCGEDKRCFIPIDGSARCEASAAFGAECGNRNPCRPILFCPAGEASCVNLARCASICGVAEGMEGESCSQRGCDPRRLLKCNPFTLRCELLCGGTTQEMCTRGSSIGETCGRNNTKECSYPSACIQSVCRFPTPSALCKEP
jgi:hypothetical protein